MTVETHGDPTGGLIFAIFEKDATSVAALEPAPPPGKPNDATYVGSPGTELEFAL